MDKIQCVYSADTDGVAATAAPATTDFESFVGIKRENREETASSHHGTLIALDIQQMYNDEEMEDNKVGVIDTDDCKQFICPYEGCAKRTKTAYRLLRHQEVHQKYRPICPYEGCNKDFISSSKMRRHLIVHDVAIKRVALSNHVCSQEGCGKRFTTLYNLQIHEKTHGDLDKLVVCPYDGCAKLFPTMGRLREHQKIHDELAKQTAKKLVCPYEGCGKQYTYHSGLRYHKLSHEKPQKTRKTYICSYEDCAKRVRTNYHLQRHLRAHRRAADRETRTSEKDATNSLLKSTTSRQSELQPTDNIGADKSELYLTQTIKEERSEDDGDRLVEIQDRLVDEEQSGEEVTIDDKTDVLKSLPFDEASRLLMQWESLKEQVYRHNTTENKL